MDEEEEIFQLPQVRLLRKPHAEKDLKEAEPIII